MFTEKITFIDGILIGNKLFDEGILEEEIFSHTLQASTLPNIDVDRLDNPAYYSAALLAVRLKIPGLFEARLESDEAFAEMVEEFAENTGRKIEDVTPNQICPVTVEMIENLSRIDGRMLMATSSDLAQRRADFRAKTLAAVDGRIVPPENGLPGAGDPEQESGRDSVNL